MPAHIIDPFRPIRQDGVKGEVRSFDNGRRLAIWQPARGWVPIWNGSEKIRWEPKDA